MELRRNSHHVFRIMYHFVWIPKYRHKVFIEPYRESLRLIIKKIGYDYNIEIVELEIPTDHIHMVVKSEPKVSPSYIMQIIKSISARNFFKLYPKIKRKYFWGGKLWTQSFFVETVGNVNDEVIREYVRNQINAMDKIEKETSSLTCFETRSLAAEFFIRYIRESFYNPLATKLKTAELVLDVDTANSEVLKWLRDTANRRVHGTTGEIPAERLKFERSNLQPLPLDYSGSHPAALEIMEDKREQFSTVSLQHSLCIYQSILEAL